MERQRQLTQVLDTMANYNDTVLLPDGTVALLETTQETVERQFPSRVNGVPRVVAELQNRYVVNDRYESLDQLAEARQRTSSEALGIDNGWRIEHIPEDIIEVCKEWERANSYPSEGGIVAAAIEASDSHVDRSHTTHPCPYCPEETRYACHNSGWSRELYRYPLVGVEDAADGQIFDVPFDVALYISTAADAVEYRVEQSVDQYEGRLTAERRVGVNPTTLSRDYIVAATDGKIVPVSNELTIRTRFPLQQAELKLDDWYEVRPQYAMSKPAPEYTSSEIIEAVQDKIMLAYGERVDETDYETMLERVRQALGEKGLGLVFGYQYCGMGETEMLVSAYNPTERKKSEITRGMDSADIIKKLHRTLKSRRTQEEN